MDKCSFCGCLNGHGRLCHFKNVTALNLDKNRNKKYLDMNLDDKRPFHLGSNSEKESFSELKDG